jgi:hypothetical protein
MDVSGFEREEVIIDSTRANIRAFTLMLPIACMVAIPYYLIWKDALTFEAFRAFSHRYDATITSVVVIVVMIAGILAHEGIHALTWALFAKKGLSSITFGIDWKELSPYCHCNDVLPLRQYIVVTAMPAIVLGFIPSVIAYVTGNFWFIIFGIFFTAAASGDFIIIRLILKESPDVYVLDHPDEVGCYIFRKPF